MRKTATLLGSAVMIAAFAAPATAAVGEIRVSPGENIAGSFIVKLKDDGVTASAQTLGSRFGGQVGHVYDTVFQGFSVRMSDAQARRLAADPSVEYVERDQVVSIQATQVNPPSWGLDRIDQRNLPLDQRYTYNSTGSGVNAYIIDTGVRITHRDFGGRAKNGYDFVDNDAVAQDGNGHGTHVAGTVAGTLHGVAKQANIIGVRVLNNSGSGTIAGVVAGVNWVASNHVKPAVANMSLGGGANTSLDNAVSGAITRGVTFAVAAGNSNTNAANTSPARVAAALTVGSTDRTDARSSFSNYGPVVDVFAPGGGITSTWNTSDTATNTISGTSMAAPHVAGVVARYLQGNFNVTPAQVATAITSNATNGKVTNPGANTTTRLLHWAPTS
ncbi:S8 family peptidase [Lentzea flaviverrucosa]|uniref:Peptidase inhibitor I9 n=1 Tax=Lentzea flaviverrucosa TaxID=200379 RepID=A0A1H9XVV9_9PSEU|nr:S8 family peptidase [Lentzea flaviverrucosa]RDI18319.1 peptidase inhibitor I9 [Lentzea flaviverrucosa]SES50256.1 Peptidase inhibitor I9 [Lentzea flaviverrucosa]